MAKGLDVEMWKNRICEIQEMASTKAEERTKLYIYLPKIPGRLEVGRPLSDLLKLCSKNQRPKAIAN